jgi:uncharacterized protein YecT (DUF1311 family)
MRFACEFEEGTEKFALPGIAKPSRSPRANEVFEFCDYAATTFTMNFCNDYELQIKDDRRSRYYNSLKSSMNAEQKGAFEKLLAAVQAYIKAHASEVDQGGTIRVVRTIESQDILEDLFHTDLVHFESRKWPELSGNQIAGVDALLHSEYEMKLKQLIAQPQEDIDEGAVSAEDLSSVEGTWEAYRDAWVEFARLRYPAAITAIRAKITFDRYRLLKTISIW